MTAESKHFAPGELRPSDRAPNLLIGQDVEIADSAWIGVNVVIADGVRVGEGVQIHHGAQLGITPSLGAHSTAPDVAAGRLEIADHAVVRGGAMVFAGARIGESAIVGDQAHVRERAVLGDRSVLGRGSAVSNDAVVGKDVRIQSMVWITGGVIVEDEVFFGPGVMTMNDDSMGRGAGRSEHEPPIFRRACRIGGGVLVTPGVTVGEEAFVAAGAVLTADVPARSRVRGVPGRVYGEVPE
jgi:acetyltransferase-like isoleucine patch superfamily enzyme